MPLSCALVDFFTFFLAKLFISLRSQKRVGVSRRRGDGAENDGKQWSGWTLRMVGGCVVSFKTLFSVQFHLRFKWFLFTASQKNPGRENSSVRRGHSPNVRHLSLSVHRDELRTVIAVHHRVFVAVNSRGPARVPAPSPPPPPPGRPRAVYPTTVRTPRDGGPSPRTPPRSPSSSAACEHHCPPWDPAGNQVEAHDARGIRLRIFPVVVVVVVVAIKRVHPEPSCSSIRSWLFSTRSTRDA